MDQVLTGLQSALEGRYLVVRELGRGGMATVYLAHDLKHDRPVALKVLHPELAHAVGPERFLREIKTVARLQHPHILSVHDSGEAPGLLWFTMPYIEGESLRDRLRREVQLPVDEALRLTREVARALDYAHRHGIVHRDVKPENILLSDGQALVADFGIARALDSSDGERLTETGMAVGTPAYMSPEQINGSRPIDGRSDIYSLGCVLFEELTGRPPFIGPTPLAILAQHLTSLPPSLHAAGVAVSAEVDDAVTRALAQRQEDRFPSAAEFASALAAVGDNISWPGVTPTGLRRPARMATLAVLPFVNMSLEPENEYFSDGITEDLINAFTKVEGLRVASRTSAFAFKGKDLDMREIGKKLNVTVVLEGSVRRAGSRLRLTAQLINAADGYYLWSETYDRQLADVFDVQDELSRAIVGTLKLRLVGEEPLIQPPTKNLEAYHLYLKGRFFWNKRSPDGLGKGIGYFEQAIQTDPGFALAYSGLADSYHVLAVYGVLPPREAYPRARAAAQRALELNDQLGESHVSVAYVALCYDWDFPKAEREFRKAIELNPQHAPAYHWLAWSLVIVGRRDEAAAAAQRAMKLEPLSPVIHARAGHTLTYAGRPEEGAAASERALELDPDFFVALETLAIAYCSQGRYEDAIAALKRAAAYPASTAPFMLPYVYAVSGRREEAERLLRGLGLDLASGRVPTGYSIMWVGTTHSALGDNDEAFRWIERLYEDKAFSILLLNAEPAYAPLRSDPRFAALVRKTGLEEQSPASAQRG